MTKIKRSHISSVLTVVALATASAAHSQNATELSEAPRAELALSDDTIQARYVGGTRISDEMQAQKTFAVFLSESRDVVGSAGLLVETDLHLLPRLTIQLGPQAYAALLSEENEDAVAVAFGAQARLDLNRGRGLAIVGHAFYAPDVLSFGSADNLSDFMARAEMRLTQRLIGFGGFRWFHFDQPDRDRRTLQNEVFAGVQWRLK